MPEKRVASKIMPFQIPMMLIHSINWKISAIKLMYRIHLRIFVAKHPQNSNNIES